VMLKGSWTRVSRLSVGMTMEAPLSTVRKAACAGAAAVTAIAATVRERVCIAVTFR